MSKLLSQSKKIPKRSQIAGAILLFTLFFTIIVLARGETYVFVLEWDNLGVGDDQFNNTYDFAVDASGNIYVTDTYNHYVQKSTNPATGETIGKTGIVRLTHTNLWAAGESLTTEQLLTLVILTAFDVALAIWAIAWHKHQEKKRRRKKESSAELHENHFGG